MNEQQRHLISTDPQAAAEHYRQRHEDAVYEKETGLRRHRTEDGVVEQPSPFLEFAHQPLAHWQAEVTRLDAEIAGWTEPAADDVELRVRTETLKAWAHARDGVERVRFSSTVQLERHVEHHRHQHEQAQARAGE